MSHAWFPSLVRSEVPHPTNFYTTITNDRRYSLDFSDYRRKIAVNGHFRSVMRKISVYLDNAVVHTKISLFLTGVAQ